YVVYMRAATQPRRGWAYAAVALCFVLGLLAKPMIVTFPFVLLLVDYWPLRRWPSWQSPSWQSPSRQSPSRRAWSWRIVVEKLPLLAIAAVSSWVTVRVQDAGGAMINLHSLPLKSRVA